jgi:hypothetical protein
MQKTSKLRRLAAQLLATTCLTAATGMAGTISYSEGVTPVDYPNSSPGTSLLAAANPGTTNISGAVSGTDAADFFELTGLGAGTFVASAVLGEGGPAVFSVFDDTSALLAGGGNSSTGGAGLFGFSSPGPFNSGSLAIPVDGNLILEVLRYHEGSSNYTVTVTTTTSGVPEPSTVGLVGVGLAGALTLARKRRKQ